MKTKADQSSSPTLPWTAAASGSATARLLTAMAVMRIGRLVGLTLVLASLTLYQSYTRREVFGRYSTTFALFILAWTVAWAAALVSTVRPREFAAASREPRRIPSADVAWMLWGTSFFLSSIDDSTRPARLLEGIVFGSTQPVGVVLDWLSAGVLLYGFGVAISRRLSPRTREWALTAAALVGILWVGEGVARVKALAWPATFGIPSYSGDLFARRYVHLNRDGYRDVDHARVPAPGRRRLLLVGDSFAFGVGIRNPDDRFGEQLTRLIQKGTDQPWESINVSHGDRHTLEEIEMLADGLTYRPSIVILLYVFNDMDYLASRFPFRPLRRPVVFETPHGIAQRVHPARIAYWNSFLFQELYARARLLSVRLGDRRRDTDPFAPYRDTAAVRTHVADLARFVSMAQASGANAVIVPLDPMTATDDRARDRYARFVNLVRSANLPIWSLEGVFEGRSLADITVNRLDGHPNALANRLASERVSAEALRMAKEIPIRP